jgi:tetratricopeptide (TPR) repeat protein
LKASLRLILKQVLLVVICLGLVAIYVSRVVRVYLAQRSAKPGQIAVLERAIRLVPSDADFYASLGAELFASNKDYDRVEDNFLNAVGLNPNQAWYWLELASVYRVTGNKEKESDAVQAALLAQPSDPEVAEEAAGFFIGRGDVNRAMSLFQRALALNPDAAARVLPLCWRQTQDVNLILANVIPGNPQLQLQFLSLLTEAKDTAAARQVWQHLLNSHEAFQPQLSFFYFDYLLKEHDAAGFDRAWHDLASVAPDLRAYLPNENLIVNGGFEQPLLNAGFDWRHRPADHIAAGIDGTVAHSGGHSLALSYDGNPADDAGWKQFVPVHANAEYEFSAWIKSDNVISSSGPRIAIVDGYSGANLFLSDDVLDTHPWQEMKGVFRVPAETESIAVKVIRSPADTRIRGRVWIDDLRLVKR